MSNSTPAHMPRSPRRPCRAAHGRSSARSRSRSTWPTATGSSAPASGTAPAIHKPPRRWYPRCFGDAAELLGAGADGELIAPTPRRWQTLAGLAIEFEGPLLHDATHLFDLMRWYAGDVVAGRRAARRGAPTPPTLVEAR
ncbi:MAG: hypothetical protein U0Z44_07950 [Kouleothrix sp.]